MTFSPFSLPARPSARLRLRRAVVFAALLPVLPLAAAPVHAATGRPASAAQALDGADPAGPRATALRLPAPTGPFAVGQDTLHLTDRGRPDPWVPEAGDRELMVTVHYPARAAGGSPGSPRVSASTARYLSPTEARLLVEFQHQQDVVPAGALSATRTNAVPGARSAQGRFPLVLLSPGFTLPRATLSTLAEDLASRGYVVATVDHAYESSGTDFPGGRTLTCVACEKYKETGIAKVAEGRAVDLSFVLDRLTGKRATGSGHDRDGGKPWARLIDPHLVAAAGHSIGGNAAAATMAADPRVRAGVNLDGTFFSPVPEEGFDGRPFLMMGTESLHRPGGEDESWDRDWQRLDGFKRWLSLRGSGHMTFTDFPVIGEQLGVVDPAAPLPGHRAAALTTAYTAAFLELHLKGRPAPLLDGPSPANPEVIFQGSAGSGS